MVPPRAKYAWNGDVAIAYGVVGDGPIDLVYIQGYISDVEMMWECPQAAAFLDRLAGWSRLITIDRRGVGMSDRFPRHELPPLEDAVKDVLCVLDAVGSQKAALFGHDEGGQLCAMLAATTPGRVRQEPQVLDGLILPPGDPGVLASADHVFLLGFHVIGLSCVVRSR